MFETVNPVNTGVSEYEEEHNRQDKISLRFYFIIEFGVATHLENHDGRVRPRWDYYMLTKSTCLSTYSVS